MSTMLLAHLILIAYEGQLGPFLDTRSKSTSGRATPYLRREARRLPSEPRAPIRGACCDCLTPSIAASTSCSHQPSPWQAANLPDGVASRARARPLACHHSHPAPTVYPSAPPISRPETRPKSRA